MKLWIITELFYPNESATAYILTEMAKKFTQEFEVNVICTDTNYEGDARRVTGETTALSGVHIIRVHTPELDKNSIVKRVVRFASVSRKLYRQAKESVRPDDMVFAVTNPAFLLLYLKRLKKIRSFNYILLVHDVFPENAAASGVIKLKPLYSLLKKHFDKAYSAADKIIVLGEDMKAIVSAKTGHADNVFVCENWGSADILPSTRSDDGKIVLQYAGNIGRVQGLEELMDVAAHVKNPFLQFDFWGSGALVSPLEEYVLFHHLTNVRMRGSYTRGDQKRVLNECDIAIVALAEGMKGLGVPSKTYNILAAGKAILYIGDEGSEIYNLVKSFDLGYVFQWAQKAEMIRWLNNLTQNDLDVFKEKGKRSRKCYEEHFTQELILNKTLETIR